jgi:hypothetical protein
MFLPVACTFKRAPMPMVARSPRLPYRRRKQEVHIA